jgi:hypothetical protein
MKIELRGSRTTPLRARTQRHPLAAIVALALLSPAPAFAQRAPAPAPAPAPGVFYQNCDAVRAAGAAPIRPGDPGWQTKFDRDGDGIGCDS